MDRCVVRRAPLLPMGSFTTCTTTSWPSRTRSRMGGVTAGAVLSALSPTSEGEARTMSEACRKAARSRPISTKAACMPGMTRLTLPL